MSQVAAAVSKRYAKALFALAVEQKAVEAVEDDVSSVSALLGESKELSAVIVNPLIDAASIGAVFKDILSKMKAHELTEKFLQVLVQNGRIACLPHAIAAFIALVKEHRGQVDAQVVSAFPLHKAQIVEIEAFLTAAMKKIVKIQESVDPEIIGGLVVSVGSKMLDGSVSGKLQSIKTSTKQAIASI